MLLGDGYYPELLPVGETLRANLRQFMGRRQRKRSPDVSLVDRVGNPAHPAAELYFIPDGLAIESFVAARQRGVKIEIIVPGPIIDEKLARRASRTRWRELLDAGVDLYSISRPCITAR